MKIIDILKLSILNIKRNKKIKTYIALLMIMTILSTSIIVFKNNVNKIINTTKNNEIEYRTIRVFGKESSANDSLESSKKQNDKYINEIMKINHVLDAHIGEESVLVVKTNAKNKYVDGTMTILRGTEKTLPNITNGRSFSNDEEGIIICPKNFYPDSEPTKINKNGLIDAKSLLNKKMEIIYQEYEYDLLDNTITPKKEYKKEFKVVGLYDTNERMNNNGTCYISPKDMREIASVEYSWDSSAYMFSSILVIIDDVDNIEYVKNQLIEKNFELAGADAYLDYNVVNTIKFSIIIAIMFTLLIIALISSSYLKKKVIRESEETAVLMSLGFRKNDIIKCFLIENLITNMLSYFFGTIVFYLLFALSTSNIGILISAKYMLGGFAIGLDSIFITFTLIVFVPIFISFIYVNKLCKHSVSKIIGESTK